MKKNLMLICLSLVINACTQSNPAEIEDISDFSGGSSKQGYTKPPVNISTGDGISAPSAPSTIYSTKSTKPLKTESSNDSGVNNSNDVIITNERITYNRNYDEIPKGGYQGDTYTVKRGDTLFYIAWVTGNDYRSLAVKNNISKPYSVVVGQVLDVSGGTTVVTQQVTRNQTTKVMTTDSSTATPIKTAPILTTTTTTTTTTSGKNQSPNTIQTTETITEPLNSDTSYMPNSPPVSGTSISNVANISWQWPANGKIIEKFSNASKGIDIAGGLGNKVMAAADGRVVYSGNALPGYGNLIIIKHNDDYLTAYAHNQSILVKEQQAVRAGEQIATMGATGTSSVRLHFEIRYKAKSVDPLKYLSKN